MRAAWGPRVGKYHSQWLKCEHRGGESRVVHFRGEWVVGVRELKSKKWSI